MWRLEQEQRISVRQAWHVAALIGWSKVPKLKSFMKQWFPEKRKRQPAEQVRAAVLEWASGAGLKVTRHERPVR